MPNRIIKESCRTSPTLDLLTAEAERLFWRLIVTADDFGRFEARPEIVLAATFPLRIRSTPLADVINWLQELSDAKLLQLYALENRLYGEFRNWRKYQTVRAKVSKFPAKNAASICNHLLTDAPVFGIGIEIENVFEIGPGSSVGSLRSPPYEPPSKANAEAAESQAAIQEVYEHYLQARGLTTDRYRLTPARRQKIRSRLDKFEIPALKAAIDECMASDFHNGTNDQAKVYLDLENNILRSFEQTERWVNKHEARVI